MSEIPVFNSVSRHFLSNILFVFPPFIHWDLWLCTPRLKTYNLLQVVHKREQCCAHGAAHCERGVSPNNKGKY